MWLNYSLKWLIALISTLFFLCDVFFYSVTLEIPRKALVDDDFGSLGSFVANQNSLDLMTPPGQRSEVKKARVCLKSVP